jgi:mRNA interferase RelE/StbE
LKRGLKAIPRRDALTILDAIGNLRDNPFPPQTMTLTGREGWRLRVGSYRAIYTVSSREITLFVVKVAHRKKSINNFLQNEANIAALGEMHDKASYQLLSLAEVAVGFAVGFSLTLI